MQRTLWPKIGWGVLGCEIAGVLSALLTYPALHSWYQGLMKPPWSPPAWVFASVWTLLFALMGAALGLVWDGGAAPKLRPLALGWFGAQLALNLTWSAAFFAGRSPAWGYAVILLLWLAIIATIWVFSRISRAAALLLLPYLAWVTFASTLNFSILSLNIIRPQVQQMDTDPRNGPADQKSPSATLR